MRKTRQPATAQEIYSLQKISSFAQQLQHLTPRRSVYVRVSSAFHCTSVKCLYLVVPKIFNCVLDIRFYCICIPWLEQANYFGMKFLNHNDAAEMMTWLVKPMPLSYYCRYPLLFFNITMYVVLCVYIYLHGHQTLGLPILTSA